MRIVLLFLLLAAAPALAQPKKPPQAHGEPPNGAAKKLGEYEDWTAASHQENVLYTLPGNKFKNVIRKFWHEKAPARCRRP